MDTPLVRPRRFDSPHGRRCVSLALAALLGGHLFAAASPDAEHRGRLLIETVKHGDHVALRALLQKKVNVNAAEPDGSTALHWAAYQSDSEAVDLLLGAGAKPNAATDLGVTPLWLASQNGNAALVARLLGAGSDPNLALLAGETPVMVAARSGYPEIVEQLLTKGAHVDARGSRGQTALMWAVSQKHPEVVKTLLAHHPDLQLRSDVWNEVMAVPPHGYLPYNKAIPHGGETALMFAARVGDLASAKLLVAAGANVNDADAWGVSATTLAAHSGFRDLVEFLLEHGADPNLAPNGFTALHEAIMRRDEEIVAALLDHHADPNAPLRTWTPTRRSSQDFHFEPSMVGATPFWLAARFLEPKVMRLLVEHGADPRFVLRVSWIASQGTGQQKRTSTATALLAALGITGENRNRDSAGSEAWVAPPRSERESLTLETVKLAVDLGDDVNAANDDGRTALDGAQALKFPAVISFLLEKGAKPGTGAKPSSRPRSSEPER
jgi:ankyrin repeat protein